MTSRKKIVIAVVACLLAAAVVFALMRGGNVLFAKGWVDKEIARIKAAGEPTTMADLAGDPIPDSENAAIIYAEIFDQLEKGLGRKDADVIGRFISPEERKKDPKLWQEARSVIARHSAALALVEEAAARPRCRFPVQWDKGIRADFPHYAKLRNLARLLIANAVLEARDGRMTEAVRSIDLGFRVADSIKGDPTLIALLVRTAIMDMTARSFRDVACHWSVDEELAKQLFDTLAKIDLELGHVKALQRMRAMGIWVFDQLRQGRDVGVVAAPFPLARDADERFYLKQMAKQIEVARLPYRVVKSRDMGDTFDPEIPKYAFVSGLLIPISTRFHLACDSARANLALMQVFLAAEAYRDRFGSYPPTLDDLKTKLGWNLPQDPFSGRDLGYRPEGKGFTIYSIGPDLKDDRGAREQKPGDHEGPGDIIWKHEPQ